MMLEDRKALVYASAAAAGAGLGALWWYNHKSQSPRSSFPTDFDSYLTVPTENPCTAGYKPTSFEAYLKDVNATTSSTTANANGVLHTPVAAAACPTTADIPPEAIPITVLYGTEYGLSKEIAEKACDLLRLATTNDNTSIPPQLWPILLDMADFPNGLPLLDRHQAVLVICSTHGDGVPPDPARDFCDWLVSADAPTLSPDTHFSVCALGDKSYTHYCRCGKTLDARLEALGASRFVQGADINKEDWKAINAWLQAVVKGLHTLKLQSFEEMGGAERVMSYAAMEQSRNAEHAKGGTKWSRGKPYYATVVEVEGLCNVDSMNDKNTVRIELDLGDSELHYTPGDALGIWPSNPPHVVAELLKELGISDKEADSTIVQLPSWHYADAVLLERSDATTNQEEALAKLRDGGSTTSAPTKKQMSMPLRDALYRCYDLRSPKVDLLHLIGRKVSSNLTKVATTGSTVKESKAVSNGYHSTTGNTATLTPSDKKQNGYQNGHLAHETTPPSNGYNTSTVNGSGSTATHRMNGLALNGHSNGALTNGYNRSSNDLQTKEQQQQQHHDNVCSNGCIVDKQDALSSLLKDSQALESYLSDRHVADILSDWQAAAQLSIGELLGTLRQLQPRLYSISSSQLESPTRVQITVAEVLYTSILGKERGGVCSTMLSSRVDPGISVLPVYVHRNPDFRLPEDLKTPIIMVGPGTGLAPFRGFMQQRLLQAKQKKQQDQNPETIHHNEGKPSGELGQAVLYFGCRRSDQDFLYGDLLRKWEGEGVLTLFTAFSREQDYKVYVQDRLRESGDLVWELLQQGAHFYVCGDAGHMAGAVEDQLLAILQEKLGTEDQARKYLEMLKRGKRYQRDVWQ